MILSCELTLLGQRVSGRAGVNTLEVPVTGTVMGRGASVARSLTACVCSDAQVCDDCWQGAG